MKKILLFGGGGCHDHRAVCPVLKEYLEEAAGFSVNYVTEDYSAFLAENLAPYDTLVLYHTGGKLDQDQKRGLVEWVASGRGFVGLHAATTSFQNAPEFQAMLGGVFLGHPFVRDYVVALTDIEHPVTRDIAGYTVKDWEKWPVFEYVVNDEQYLLDYDPRVRVLATSVYSGILPRAYPKGALWPVAWVKNWDKGRMFYLALGHNVSACQNPFFRKIFANGVKWASDAAQEPA